MNTLLGTLIWSPNARCPWLTVTPTPATQRVHLLVDWENVQPKGDELKTLVPEGTDVWLFHGRIRPWTPRGMSRFTGSEQVTRVPRTGAGRNALDFQLAYYVGYISARQPEGRFVVVSNDKGMNPCWSMQQNWGLMRSGVGFAGADTARRIRRMHEVPCPPAAAASAAASAGGEPCGEATVKTNAKAAAPPPSAKLLRPAPRQRGQIKAAGPAGWLPAVHRPRRRTLLVLWLGESSVPVAAHIALAQLQARKAWWSGRGGVFHPPWGAPARGDASAPKSAAKRGFQRQGRKENIPGIQSASENRR